MVCHTSLHTHKQSVGQNINLAERLQPQKQTQTYSWISPVIGTGKDARTLLMILIQRGIRQFLFKRN